VICRSFNSTCMLAVLTIGCTAVGTSIAPAADSAPLERIATIDSRGIAGTLDHLFVDSATSRLFLANQSNNTLDVVDVKGNQLLKQIAGQQTAHSVVYVPAIERIFVGCGAGVCNVIDAKSYALLKSLPVDGADSVRFDSRTSRVFVASRKSVTLLDGKSLEMVAKVNLPGTPHGLQVANTNPYAYVNTDTPNQVAVVDTGKNEVVATYKLAGDSKGIGPLALDEASGRIFVGLRAQPRLAVLDIGSGKELATAPIPEGADDMFQDPETKRIYISCSAGFIAVIRQIDADHYESITDVPTVRGAKTSFYDRALKRLYVGVPRQPNKEGPEIWAYQAR
jgi:DNA-binding beta-propeller fold protein YncE